MVEIDLSQDTQRGCSCQLKVTTFLGDGTLTCHTQTSSSVNVGGCTDTQLKIWTMVSMPHLTRHVTSHAFTASSTGYTSHADPPDHHTSKKTRPIAATEQIEIHPPCACQIGWRHSKWVSALTSTCTEVCQRQKSTASYLLADVMT